ncbi:hypothetical protein BCR39DRAFT_548100 [Naematelia encephala]|uniref:Uncharacterized protein n=1 Tax=Naematelia encephala TaxID=71784 RepID=A0A1Y2AN71_9TREE|nr:hypothetical protein BCR39DRAFT_548100 [Naematelia encephala]
MRGESDIDSDPYTDSDEESLRSRSTSPSLSRLTAATRPAESDSQASSSSTENDQSSNDPRKLRRSRISLRIALRCTFAILDESLDENAPWEGLGKQLIILRRGLSDQRTIDDRGISACLMLFEHFSFNLVRLTQNKVYAREELSRSEARSQPVFLRALDKIRPLLPQSRLCTSRGNTEVLDRVPLVVLDRLVGMALGSTIAQRTKLDLSSLHEIALGDIDFPTLLHLYGMTTNEVTHLNLASNNLISQYNWYCCVPKLNLFSLDIPDWPIFPFDNLQVMDLSSNPSLSFLPFSITKLAYLRRLRIRHTSLQASTDMPTFARIPLRTKTAQTSLPRRGTPSLLLTCVKLLLIYRGRPPLSDLPTHLVNLINASFICDLCEILVPPSEAGQRPSRPITLCWIVKDRTTEKTRQAKEVRVEGRLCRSCMNARVNLPHGL